MTRLVPPREAGIRSELKVDEETTTNPERADAALSGSEQRALQRRSDARGLLRFAGHLGAIAAAAALYATSRSLTGSFSLASLGAAVIYGFTLVTMFAAMHEAVHRTAFKSTWL